MIWRIILFDKFFSSEVTTISFFLIPSYLMIFFPSQFESLLFPLSIASILLPFASYFYNHLNLIWWFFLISRVLFQFPLSARENWNGNRLHPLKHFWSSRKHLLSKLEREISKWHPRKYFWSSRKYLRSKTEIEICSILENILEAQNLGQILIHLALAGWFLRWRHDTICLIELPVLLGFIWNLFAFHQKHTYLLSHHNSQVISPLTSI